MTMAVAAGVSWCDVIRGVLSRDNPREVTLASVITEPVDAAMEVPPT